MTDQEAARAWMLSVLGYRWVTVDVLPPTTGVLPHEVGELGPWHGFRLLSGDVWGWSSNALEIEWELSRRVADELSNSPIEAFLAGAAHGRAAQREADAGLCEEVTAEQRQLRDREGGSGKTMQARWHEGRYELAQGLAAAIRDQPERAEGGS